MDLFIHYSALPEGKTLTDIVGELEDENVNPKFAQIAVKSYLQRAGFPRDTAIEIGGMEIGLYE